MGEEHQHKHRHGDHGDEAWANPTACSSGMGQVPRDEEELQDMRALWKSVLQKEGKLISTAVRPTDAARRPARDDGGGQEA